MALLLLSPIILAGIAAVILATRKKWKDAIIAILLGLLLYQSGRFFIMSGHNRAYRSRITQLVREAGDNQATEVNISNKFQEGTGKELTEPSE